jgi:uncharacterized SAM-binding protein YcdF (DUF218 family)
LIPIGLKDLFVPGSFPFLLFALVPGILLLFRKKDAGRAGKIWIAFLGFCYWVLSTPVMAIALVHLCTPVVHPVMSKADARGATAIVVLGAGMGITQSRGGEFGVPTREGSLRVLEAARLHRLLDGAPIIATGGLGSSQYSEAGMIAHQLDQLGVPPDKIIKEEKATNTRDHAILVPPILKAHGIEQFVLVTSQQHIARALAAFRKVGIDPVPSTPEVYVRRGHFLEPYLPSRTGLSISESTMYDLLGWVYYKARGWV